MRHARLAIAAILVLGLASPALSAPKPRESWGRAGVDFETYRQDAEECGRMAYYADVSETDHAKAFVRGTKRLESIDGLPLDFLTVANLYAQAEHSVRPEWRMRVLRAGLQAIVEECLTRRGYVKFHLTEAQRERIEDLRKGSSERHRFLHALASDPEVLTNQAMQEG